MTSVLIPWRSIRLPYPALTLINSCWRLDVAQSMNSSPPPGTRTAAGRLTVQEVGWDEIMSSEVAMYRAVRGALSKLRQEGEWTLTT